MTITHLQHVTSTREYFIGIGIWGAPMELNPNGWLANFDDDDRATAAHLLDGYNYLEARMVNKLFDTGFRRLVSEELSEESASSALARWEALRDSARVSFPTTHVTDSGHRFVAIARDRFGVSEDRIHDVPALIAELSTHRRASPVVLVDDFTGTGDQFVRTVATEKHGGSSLTDEIARLGIVDAHFVVAVATHEAKHRIESSTPFRVSAGNVLPSSASILHDETHLVPAEHRVATRELIERYSARAGIANPWGYKSSALALSFAHKTPNNTMPIFTEENDLWTPLIRYI